MDKIKVPADNSKTSYIRFRLPAWKKEAFQQVCEQKGVTMSALILTLIDKLIKDIEIEIERQEKNKA